MIAFVKVILPSLVGQMSWAVLARSSPNNSGPTLWFFEHNGLKSGCKMGVMASFRLNDSSRHTWPKRAVVSSSCGISIIGDCFSFPAL